MPKILIKRSPSNLASLDAGELGLGLGESNKGRLFAGLGDGGDTDRVRVKYADNADNAQHASNADNAADSVYSQKVGTSSSHPQIGSSLRPVYVDNTGTVTASTGNAGTDETTTGGNPLDHTKGLKPIVLVNGVLQGATETHGSAICPVYVDQGKIVPSNGSVGGDDRDTGLTPIFMSGGVFTAAYRTHGSPTQPVYVSSGSIVAGDPYAGGTKVTVNGDSYAGQSVSFYAPVSAPNGHDKRLCAWKDSSAKAEFMTATIGSNSKPIYLNEGVPTAMSNNIGGSTKPVYMLNGVITASNANEGTSLTPVYMSNGYLTECAKYAGATRCTFGGSYSSNHAFFKEINSWGTGGDVYDYSVDSAEDGVYLIVARDTSGAKNLYTLYVAVYRDYLTYANSMCYSASFVTQPSSGNPHSCRVRVSKYGTGGLRFLLEDDSDMEWRFVKIIRISSL